MYKGIHPAFWRDVPTFGIYFWINEFVQRSLKDKRYFKMFEKMAEKPGWLTLLEKLMAGGLAGTVIWGISYPFDILKSQFQVQQGKAPRMIPESI